MKKLKSEEKDTPHRSVHPAPPLDWAAHERAVAWADAQVRALVDQWFSLTQTQGFSRITSWSFVPGRCGDCSDLLVTGTRGRPMKTVELRFPEIWLTASRGLRTKWILQRQAEEIRTGQDEVTATANARIAELRAQIAEAEAQIGRIEASKRPQVQRITLEMVEDQRLVQILRPERLLAINTIDGGHQTNAAILARAIAGVQRVDAEVVIPAYGTRVPVRILPKEALEVADTFFAATGIRDRETYLARTAQLKAELRESGPAIRAARGRIRARLRAGDTVKSELNELEALRTRFRRAHDERRLARAWAGAAVARRRAAELAHTEDTAGAA